MKKIIMLFFAVSTFGLLLLNGCVKDEDTCDKSLDLASSENRTFNFDGIVKNGDGTLYVGTVEIVMYKTYCDGRENGKVELSKNTNADGKWYSSWNQTYTYSNFDDSVSLEIYIEGDFVEQYVWYWQDVDTENTGGYVFFTAKTQLSAI